MASAKQEPAAQATAMAITPAAKAMEIAAAKAMETAAAKAMETAAEEEVPAQRRQRALTPDPGDELAIRRSESPTHSHAHYGDMIRIPHINPSALRAAFSRRLAGRTLRPSFVSTIAMNSAPPSGRSFGLRFSNSSSAACSSSDSSKRSAKRGARSSAGPTSTSASSRPLKMRAHARPRPRSRRRGQPSANRIERGSAQRFEEMGVVHRERGEPPLKTDGRSCGRAR